MAVGENEATELSEMAALSLIPCLFGEGVVRILSQPGYPRVGVCVGGGRVEGGLDE